MEKKLDPPKGFKKGCNVCGRDLELRLGFCFDCATLQAMLIDGEDMDDNDCSHWTKTQLLAHIVRNAMRYQ